MKPKQILITVLCICTLFALAACGKNNPTASTITNKSDIPPSFEDNMDDPDYPYVCNHITNFYHLTTCPDVSVQESKIFTYYKSEENAKQNGYIPCARCLP